MKARSWSSLKADPEVSAALPATELDALFNMQPHLRNVDAIFERVFASS